MGLDGFKPLKPSEDPGERESYEKSAKGSADMERIGRDIEDYIDAHMGAETSPEVSQAVMIAFAQLHEVYEKATESIPDVYLGAHQILDTNFAETCADIVRKVSEKVPARPARLN